MNSPNGLAFDPSGNLFVSNFSNGTIEKYSSTGTDLGVFASGLIGPSGLAFDSQGNLFATNSDSGAITEYNSSGSRIGSFDAQGVSPIGLAFDSQDHLYAAFNSSDKINRYTSGGVLLNVVASTPGVQDDYLAILDTGTQSPPLAVPEPGTLPSVAAGLLCLCLHALSRRLSGQAWPA